MLLLLSWSALPGERERDLTLAGHVVPAQARSEARLPLRFAMSRL